MADYEARMIQLALRRGWLDETELLAAESGSDEGGSRLSDLMGKGLLSAEQVAALEREINPWDLDDTVPDPTDPQVTGQSFSVPLDPPESTDLLDHSEPGEEVSWTSLGLPFETWDRFQPVGPLGQGGMGFVIKAFDPRLRRHVALKFIRSGDPEKARRLQKEAQTQAQVNHPNVCTVHEVGSVEGVRYIAMNLIKGRTLAELAADLVLRDKVRLMVDVCEAVHAAHRAGLIHRDLKPANVMAQQDGDGRWVPCVLDFGLAESVEELQGDRSAKMGGTPAYYSPEQAGADFPLSERTDVYGLGACLYVLLAGHPPFQGEDRLQLMYKVMFETPTPLREEDASIPEDLQAIVQRAMNKHPDRRYVSARELALDLGRFLAGDPVSAVPQTFRYRMAKRIRKYPLLSGLLVLAILVCGVLGGLAAVSQLRAREQARIAHRLGVEVSAVEQQMQQALLLPRHDIRPERGVLLRRLEALEREMDALGRLGRGPALHALGRGYLALDELSVARDYLETAWNEGYQPDELAQSLGQVLGLLYQQEVSSAAAMMNLAAADQQRQRAETTLRPRVLEMWDRAGLPEDAGNQSYHAFYEGDYEHSARLAEQAASKHPGAFVFLRLQASALFMLCETYLQEGMREEARKVLAQAGAAAERAVTIARSDPASHALLCHRWLGAAWLDAWSGQDPSQNIEKADKAASAILEIDPEHVRGHVLRAYAHWLLSEYQMRHGIDPRPSLNHTLKFASATLDLDPDQINAHSFAGLAAWTMAEMALRMRSDPSAWLDRAERHFRNMVNGLPSAAMGHLNLGLVLGLRGRWAEQQGGDPVPHWMQALACFQKALELAPEMANAWTNMANTYTMLADHAQRRGEATDEAWLDGAIDALKHAIEINPAMPPYYANLAAAYWSRVEYDREAGRDLSLSLQAALEALEKAVNLDPNYPTAIYNRGNILWLYAVERAGRDEEFVSLLRQAAASFSQVAELSHAYTFALPYAAGAYRTAAELLLAMGRDPHAEISAADQALERAEDAVPDSLDLVAENAEIALLHARLDAKEGRNPAPRLSLAEKILEIDMDVQDEGACAVLTARANWARLSAESSRAARDRIVQGLKAADQALALDATSDRTRAIRGELHLLAASEAPRSDETGQHLKAAVQDLEFAIRRAPALLHEFGPVLTRVRNQLNDTEMSPSP